MAKTHLSYTSYTSCEGLATEGPLEQDITISRSFWDLLGVSEPVSGQIHLASTAPNVDD
jgi:hypothetical protein